MCGDGPKAATSIRRVTRRANACQRVSAVKGGHSGVDSQLPRLARNSVGLDAMPYELIHLYRRGEAPSDVRLLPVSTEQVLNL
jgi:hypothetical protein